MNSGFSMFILDIEPFFQEAVRGPDAVALMRSIGHQQIKPASGAGQSITSEFTKTGQSRRGLRPRVRQPHSARFGGTASSR
jgi:hypothetical protein